ncbi:DUF3558 family protein [Nocardia camponoti]|uniref:DUF3558 family protein n=1 Tax=Nocardia camponoti TaxID=1616106 RepID=UPI003570D349
MNSTRSGVRSGLLLSCALALVTVGCTNDPGTEPPSSSPTEATSVSKPADFDPCTDIPDAVLTSEQLRKTRPEDSDSAGVTTHGCGYFMLQGYDVRIVRTSVSLSDIKAKFPDSYREQQFGSRQGAYYTLFPQYGDRSCVINVAMNTGSLEFDLRNPATASKTGDLDTCQLATDLTNKIVPLIPESA